MEKLTDEERHLLAWILTARRTELVSLANGATALTKQVIEKEAQDIESLKKKLLG